MHRLALTPLVLLMLAAFTPGALAAPPDNDAFADRITLSGSFPVITSGTNIDATKQGGEPYHGTNAGGRSVWWTWTAPGSGHYTIRTDGSDFDTTMGVYAGTAINALTLIIGDDDAGAGNNSLVSFAAAAGATYQIAVDGFNGTPGNITLTIDPPVPLPENDHFANRTSLGNGAASIDASNLFCSKEAGEPNHDGYSGGRSVWFTWTAPANGECNLRLSDYSFSPLLGVYTGSAVNALTLVASSSFGEPSTFIATAGTVYQFAVDGESASGAFTLSINNPVPPPANDNFASGIVIPSVPASIPASNEGATQEPDEPDNYDGYTGGKSVWWQWTAPATGEFVLQITGANYGAVFAIYTGSAVDALTTVASSSGSLTSIRVVAGTTYRIAVDGMNASSGSFTLGLSQVYTPPGNDSFAGRTVLPASGTSVSGTNRGATNEAGEPSHGGGSGTGGRSLWWSWTAPSSGEVTLTITPTFNPLVSVYTGSSLNALTQVVGQPFSGLLSFNAVAGTTYQIALDTYGGDAGTFSLRLSDPVPPPSNDNFANRILLSGTSVKTEGSNQGAGKETGEPNHAGNVGGKSVWYSWMAPSTGSFTAYVQADNSFSNRLLGIYTGASVSTLTTIASTNGGYGSPLALPFSATSGTTYHIAVDGYHNGQFAASGGFVLNVTQPPANETFAAATNLGSATSGTSTSWLNYGSGSEAGEPGAPAFPWLPSPRTIWWMWTAPATGFYGFHTLGADFDTVMQVYTGASVSALTRVVENHDADSQGRSSLAITATIGTVYYIRVSGETPDDIGQVQLQWSQISGASTAADYVALGRAWLQQQTSMGVTNANTAFADALAIDANHAEANFLKALTTFALLEQGTALQNALTGLGIVDSDIYERGWGIPKDGLGNRVTQPGATTTAVAVNYLADTALPALTVIRAHLDKVSSPSFVTTLSDTETSDRFLILDAGDVSLIRACLDGLEAVTRLLQTYNAGVNVADVITAANNDALSVENVAKSFTDLLTFTGNDQRAAFKTALQSANTHYQAGSTFVRTTRVDKRDDRHLFYLTASGDTIEEEIRENLQATSNSLNGAASVGGETVNLAQAITSPKSLREQLLGLVGNKGVVSTAPDPTFDGVLPNSNQTKVNRFLRRTGFLHEIASFSNWAAAFLGGQTVPNQAKTADPDKDMLSNFAEYAFNLNPGKSSATQEYAVNSLQTNVSDGKKYLTLTFVRRIDRATIDYVVAVSDNLSTWDRTGTQLQQVGAATPNADGVTETVTVRVTADPQVTNRKFVRLEVSDLNP